MNTIIHIYTVLEKYNRLIKYELKKHQTKEGNVEDKDLIQIDDLFGNNPICEINYFKSEVKSILQSNRYPKAFTELINRIYFLSSANSDLLIEGNSSYNGFIKDLKKTYPVVLELDKLSFEVFEFLYYKVFNPQDEFENTFHYPGFENLKDNLCEYTFKDNFYLLYSLYHLTRSLCLSFVSQQITDYRNNKALFNNPNIQDIQAIIEKYTKKIWGLSQNIFNRNLIADYIKKEISISKEELIGKILSDILEKLTLNEYRQYVLFDYSRYNKDNFSWSFEKNTLADYPGLTSLPHFEQLTELITSVLFIEELEKENTIPEVTESTNVPKIEKTSLTEQENPKEINTEETLIPLNKKDAVKEEISFLPISILDLIHEEFNGELWQEIPILDFLKVFTTAVNYQANFKIKQKTRFYYLLKQIWLKSETRHLFESEKKWLEKFASLYKLSVSAYWNQSVKTEGGYKNREFIKRVDRIFK